MRMFEALHSKYKRLPARMFTVALFVFTSLRLCMSSARTRAPYPQRPCASSHERRSAYTLSALALLIISALALSILSAMRSILISTLLRALLARSSCILSAQVV